MMSKKFFLKSILVLGLIAFLPMCSIAKTQGSIYVNESANIDAAPDTIEFSITIRTDDKGSLDKASTENKEISKKIYDEFSSVINKANGDYIKTTNYSAHPVYHYANSKQIFDRYEVLNIIMVHTKNITKAGSYIDKALQYGATTVGNLNYTLSDTDSYCNDLLKKATQKAKTRAEVIAQALGQNLAGIKEIRTSCSANAGRRYSGLMMAKSMDAANGAQEVVTPIEGGSLKIYANIDADFYTE